MTHQISRSNPSNDRPDFSIEPDLIKLLEDLNVDFEVLKLIFIFT